MALARNVREPDSIPSWGTKLLTYTDSIFYHYHFHLHLIDTYSEVVGKCCILHLRISVSDVRYLW